MRISILSFLLLLSVVGYSQGFTFTCNRDTNITGCANSCLTLKALVPDLHASTASYVINPLSQTTGCFASPVPPNDAAGTSASLTIDDRYSSVINIGFPFSFYGANYTQLVASTNGYVSFDVTLAGQYSHWPISNNLPSTSYDAGLIMGPYHDLYPGQSTSPTQRIQYQVLGTAPHRRWVLSFYKVPLFSCTSLIENTHQIVLYEGTGVIEVFIFSKEICSAWNSGKAIVGLQDMTRTQGIMAPGRSATDAPWGSINMNESWRFVPAAGASLLKRVELRDVNNNLIGLGTTAASTNGNLEATFTNVCPPTGLTKYVVRSVYQKIDDPAQEVYGVDTIRVNKANGTLAATATSVATNCSNNNGTITVNTTTGVSPYQYSLNGGAYQASNVFNGLAQGPYVVSVKDNLGCTYNVSANVALTNNLTLQMITPDTTVCRGSSFTPRVNSNATQLAWSPAGSVNNATVINPSLTPTQTTRYTLTGTLGACTKTATLNVTTFQGITVRAGSPQTILAGDQIQLNGSVSGTNNTYVWSPSTGLSATNILNPIANPAVTTTYTLTATSQIGCSEKDSVKITVLPYCVTPMNSFTPNGDGVNDNWLVTNGGCTTYIFAQVFNRYGNKVFESDNYQNNWKGTYNGQPLPDGTYYYVVSYKLINGRTVTQKGNVTILR
jgi:gliding motility-associated-like protein